MGNGNLNLQGPITLGGSVPITVSGGSLTLSGSVSGGFPLNIAGPGTTILASTNNSYTGGTSLTAGAQLQFANASSFSTSGYITLNGNSTLACTAPAGSQSIGTLIDIDTGGGMIEVPTGVNLTVRTLYALDAGNPVLVTGGGTLALATAMGCASAGNTIAPALGVTARRRRLLRHRRHELDPGQLRKLPGQPYIARQARLNLIGPGVVGGGGTILTGDNSSLVGYDANGTPTATTLTNTIQLAGPGKTLNIGATEGNSIEIDSSLTGNGNVDITTTPGGEGGAGVVVLSQVNTYTGQTTICSNYASPTSGLGTAGFLRLGVDDALPNTALVFGSTVSGVYGGALDLNGHTQHVASIQDLSYCDGVTNSSVGVGTLHITGSAVTTFGSAIGKVAGQNSAITNDNIALTLDSSFSGVLTLTYGGLTVYADGSSAVGNTYTGGTTVNGGLLLLNNSSSASSASGYGPVSVNNGGTLGGLGWAGSDTTVAAGGTLLPGAPGQPGTLHFATNLTLAANSAVNFNLSSGSDSMVAVNNTLTLPTSGHVTINLTDLGGGLKSSPVPLFTFGSLASTFSASSLAIGSGLPAGDSYSFTETGGTIDLDLILTRNLTWSGSTGGGVWDVNTTPSFAGSQTFNNGSSVTFDDSGSGGTVSIASQVTPAVTFSNSAKSYLLTGGTISGPTSLILSGGGSVELDNTNVYTGGTYVNNGFSTVDTPAALPSGSTLIVGDSGAFGEPAEFGGAMSGGNAVPGARAGQPSPACGRRHADRTRCVAAGQELTSHRPLSRAWESRGPAAWARGFSFALGEINRTLTGDSFSPNTLRVY